MADERKMMNSIEPLTAEMNTTSACRSIIRLLDGIAAVNALCTLSYGQLEVALKAAMYIDECVHLVGGRLQLQEQCNNPIYERVLQNEEIFGGNALKFVMEKILQTKNASDHIYALEQILKTTKSPTEIDELWQTVVVPTCSSDSSIRIKPQSQMENVVQRLFKLPTGHIDTAVERLLAQFHFRQLGEIFCEDAQSPCADKYIVCAHKICTRLADGVVPNYFIDSMLDTIQYSDEGIHFYWKCLTNESFSQALSTYFIKFIQKTDTAECKRHAIVTLASAALRDESPCQRMLYDKLYNAQMSPYWLNLFHNAVFIFD